MEFTMNKNQEDFSVVVCRTGHEPEIVPVPQKFDYSYVRQLVQQADQVLKYPNYLKKGMPKGVGVACDGSALTKQLPVNRWGIFGDFLVYRATSTYKGLKTSEAELVVRHMTEEYGYLRPDSGVWNISHERIGFYGNHVKSPQELEEDGEEFDPDLHFTGTIDPQKTTFINWLLNKVSANVVAAFAYSPFPNSFSIELQFGTSDEDQQRLIECQRLYQAAFTSAGNLKQGIAQRPPKLATRRNLKATAM